MKVTKDVRCEHSGIWGVNVWLGVGSATNVLRYYYTTRAQARKADISDYIWGDARVFVPTEQALPLRRKGITCTHKKSEYSRSQKQK